MEYLGNPVSKLTNGVNNVSKAKPQESCVAAESSQTDPSGSILRFTDSRCCKPAVHTHSLHMTKRLPPILTTFCTYRPVNHVKNKYIRAA